ncbi:16S rRNA (uracil(1498)-N(3))-methyltransferase [Hufsiella ginkgonis]|uniref:Ribosomal RNA small subunit methyltransferase E n=1 Tax=Hufsiella ginkgonis TaxID=2695274 RepID=A0A7K1Y2N1_9SPHI|nr:16S rRNA (uracil(1498)-N(3))-methyltransferase [Hufsiella ginkgonis]MXV17510.1 16S rRNA (uracil(1498)-N(3))-methyltransferase [Hufsiella ginkgonis]
MHIFYTPGVQMRQPGDAYILNEEESKHAVRVLRLAAGDEVFLADGEGGWYTAQIDRPEPKATVLKLLSVQRSFEKRNHYLHIAVAPTKNIERLEWFLEKATEIGIDEITPLICDRSERREVKTQRLLKVIISAMKQSLKAYLPKLNEPVKFGSFVAAGREGQSFIAHCMDTQRLVLREQVRPNGRYTVLIGPEGDFSVAEVQKAALAGYLPISLGNSRLRTETAALEACFEINYLNRS